MDSNADGSEGLYRLLVESLGDYAVLAMSPGGDIITWNAGAQTVFGYTKAEAVGRPFGLIFTADDVQAGAPATELADAQRGCRTQSERRHLRKDGTTFWASYTVSPMYGAAGTLIGFATIVADTSESFRAREALRESEERLRLRIESIPEYAIFSLATDGSITTWNSAAHRTLGYAEHEILGKHFAELFSPDDVANGVPSIVLQKATALGAVDEERWFVRKDGTRFLGSEKISRLKTGSKSAASGFVHIAQDITARNEFADELRRRASIDALTELPNRSTFLDHVNRAIAAMKRRASSLFAVLFIDLDHFKEINDTFGHTVADRLLEITARRLERCARTEDIVARIGGDEFAILLNSISDIRDAEGAAQRIGAEMRKSMPVDGRSVRATVSIGIALGSPHYDRPEDVLRDADTAMYVAKGAGRGRSMVFVPQGGTATGSDGEIESDLRHAVDRNELRVFYQPVLRLSDSSVAGFEALVRWEHPTRGLLGPQDFVPKAEESDLICAIDHWVLRNACRALAGWREHFPAAELSINVNFSSKEFSRPDLLAELQHVLAATGLPAGALHLEITESAIMEQSDRTSTVLGAIRDLGIQLQIDDFGIGYSSLATLGRTPAHALKIDRSFVESMESRTGKVLVHSITHLAHNLGLVAIAEGIETDEQLAGLLAMRCEFGQGFLFAAPLEGGAAEAFLRAHAPGVA